MWRASRDNKPSLFTLQVDGSALGNVHLPERDPVGDIRSIKGVRSSWNRDGNASKEK